MAPADLAVNKVLAASTRRKARDVVDIASIGEHFCPIGPLAMAASGKPPHFSPLRILHEIRRNCQSIWREDYLSVKGMPAAWTPEFICGRVLALLDEGEVYINAAPDEVVGRLAIDAAGTPVEVSRSTLAHRQLRAPSEEQEVVPQFKDGTGAWTAPGR